MGKYYSAAANADPFTNSNGFAIANIDIIVFASWFAGSITFSDIRFPDREPDARQVRRVKSFASRGPNIKSEHVRRVGPALAGRKRP